jgi:isopentenyl-diphosphate delta-isomerase
MSRASRKVDHINHALEIGQLDSHGFEDVKFVHYSLPDIDMADIKIDTTIGGLRLSSPIIINAMTGGAEQTFNINQKLAIVANEKGLAMAVGSQMAALKEPNYAYTYEIVRKENPHGIVLSNLGSEATVDQAKRAIAMLEADALQIHVNVVQELVMPEGDRHFKGTLARIEQLVRHINCPIIVKEVGFGISSEAARQLESIGVKVIDIGGYGGTNFAQIENKRRDIPFESFNDWGIRTVPSLVEVTRATGVDVISSGGIKTPLELMKSIALGAKAVGMAGFFLKHAMNSPTETLLGMLDSYHEELKSMMCALGVSNFDQVSKVPLVLAGESYHWLYQRGFPIEEYARR